MVAHLIPTLYFRMASAESIVILSLVWKKRETMSVPELNAGASAQCYAGKTTGTYGISGFEPEVIVLDVKVEVWKDELRRAPFSACAHILNSEGTLGRFHEPLHESSSR